MRNFFLQRCCLEWTTTLRHYKLSYIFSRSTGPVEQMGTVGICSYQPLQKSLFLSGLIFALIAIKLLLPSNFKTILLGLKDNVLIGQFDNFMRKAFRDNQVKPHFDIIFWGMHPPTPNFLIFPIVNYNYFTTDVIRFCIHMRTL